MYFGHAQLCTDYYLASTSFYTYRNNVFVYFLFSEDKHMRLTRAPIWYLL